MLPSTTAQDTSLSAGAATILRDLTDRLLRSTSAADWVSSPGNVKQARIACRRLREALQLLGPRLQPKRAAQLVRDVELLAAPLAVLRDLDVVAALIEAEAEREPALEAVHYALALMRRHAANQTKRRLAADRVQQLASRLHRYGRSITERDAGGDMRRFAADRLIARHQRLTQRAAEVDVQHIATIHALRRSLRRFRYDAEAFLGWLELSPEALSGVKVVQDYLGAITDREALLKALDNIGKDLPRGSAGAVAVVVARVDAELRQLVDGVTAAVAPLVAPAVPEELFRALGTPFDG